MGEPIKVFFKKKGHTQLKQSTIHLCSVSLFHFLTFVFIIKWEGLFFFSGRKIEFFFIVLGRYSRRTWVWRSRCHWKIRWFFKMPSTRHFEWMKIRPVYYSFFLGTSHEIYGSTSIIITQKQTRFVDKHNQIKIYNCWLIMIIFLWLFFSPNQHRQKPNWPFAPALRIGPIVQSVDLGDGQLYVRGHGRPSNGQTATVERLFGL